MESQFCPLCGVVLQPDARGGLRCSGCGAVLAEPLTLCPRCGYRNENESVSCLRCSADLTAACPGCGRTNWAGAERCGDCGRELDILGHAFRPFGKSVEMRQDELLRMVPGLREKEGQESRRRVELLLETDRRRVQRSAEAAARAKLREQRIIRGVGVAVIGFLVVVLLAAVFFL